MTTFTAFNKMDSTLSANFATPTEDSVRRWTAGLFISVIIGAASGLGGLVLGFLTLFGVLQPSTGTYTTNTMLIGAAFIFFGLAAHCLDKAAAAEKAIRLEYCRQHGMKDEECVEVKIAK